MVPVNTSISGISLTFLPLQAVPITLKASPATVLSICVIVHLPQPHPCAKGAALTAQSRVLLLPGHDVKNRFKKVLEKQQSGGCERDP